MQVTISIYCFYTLQCFVLLHEVYRLFSRKVAFNSQRMLFLALLQLVSNTLWILTISGSIQGVLSTALLSASSLGTLIFTDYLWRIQLGKLNSKNGLNWFAVHSIAVGFLLSQLYWTSGTVEHDWTFIFVFTYAQSVALFFGANTLLQTFRKNGLDRFHQRALLVWSVVICFIPLILFFVQYFAMQYILLNSGFFFMVFAYRKESYLKDQVTLFSNHQGREVLDKYDIKSKPSIFSLGKKLERIDAYQQQLSDCLERNRVLENESIEKSKIIEQYKNQSKNTIESVLFKYELTERQFEVVKMMVEGMTNLEISEALFIKEGVVRVHLSKAYEKTGIRGAHKLRIFILKQIESK